MRHDDDAKEALYLRENVQVEPLVDSWYAWAHLIPPATYSRNITGRHLRILKSYLAGPALHSAAVRDPRMLGGPFIDYPSDQTVGVGRLLSWTETSRAGLISMSNAITDLDKLLSSHPRGLPLYPLYSLVPAPLRGYVELTYDLNNNTSFRLVEPLLYQSDHYDRSSQTLALSIIESDDRPFVLSTPRLESDSSIHLHLSFDNPTVDWLFRLKRNPASWSRILSQLDIPANKLSLLHSFFTPIAPQPYAPYCGTGVRWRYFGHACILVETKGLVILFDPVLSYTYETNLSRYTYADLPDHIDYVIITHNHQDHILFETLLQIRHKVTTFLVPHGNGSLQDPSIRLMLTAIGCQDVREIGEMETLLLGTGSSIMGIPFWGEHADLSISSKLGYLLRIREHKLLFLADSRCMEPSLYSHIHRHTGDADVIFLGMECEGAPLSWLYGPLVSQPIQRSLDQARRLSGSSCEEGLAIITCFRPREVYVYAMGQEPWLNYVMSVKYTDHSRPIVESDRLLKNCLTNGIYSERLFGERELFVYD